MDDVIYIRTQLNVINGFVEIPHSQKMRTKLTPLDVELLISGTSEKPTGQVTRRRMIVFSEFDRMNGYPADWFAALRNA